MSPARRKSPEEVDLRKLRVELERKIADLLKQQQHYYTEWVKPNAGEAKMMTVGGKAGSQIKVLSLEAAGVLDLATPTGRFEYGRAYVEDLSGQIRRLRNQEAKLAKEVGRFTKEVARRRPDYRAKIRKRVLG